MSNKIFFTTIGNIYKSFLTLLVTMAFLSSQVFIGGLTTSVAQKPPTTNVRVNPRIAARIAGFKTRGSQYNLALTQVRTLAGKSLNSEQDVKSAIAELRKHRAVLDRGPHQFLVDMALNDESFKRAVEAEAEKVGANALIDQINANSSRVMSISGAGPMRAKMTKALNQMSQDFKNLGNKLTDAKTRLQPRRPGIAQNISLAEIDKSPFVLTKASYRMFVAENKLTNEKNYDSFEIVPTGYSFSNAFPEPGGAAVREPITISAALVAATVLIIAAWGAAKVQDTLERDVPPGADEDYDTRSDFKKCTDKAEARNDRCLEENENDFWGSAACWAQYTAKMAECIILPQ